MFSYIRKINKLYNDDGSEADDAVLFDSQTIAKWAKWATEAKPDDDIEFSEDIPPMFSYS